MVRRGCEADWQQLLMHNCACLRRVLGKVARGDAVKVASYGDSIVAVQLGDLPYTANGTGRDRPENYLINMPADTVAALPKYDFGDGAGPVHVKISAVWSLIEALEQASGQPVKYLNFGRGGSTSANTQHNGLWPARLQPVLDSGADVLLHFGMNELGQSTTLANIKSITSQARAVGMDVIVMSVPRRNVVDGPALTGWNNTNRALWRAAVEAGAAFAPQHWIVTDEQLGGMGASPDSLGAVALFTPPPGRRSSRATARCWFNRYWDDRGGAEQSTCSVPRSGNLQQQILAVVAWCVHRAADAVGLHRRWRPTGSSS